MAPKIAKGDKIRVCIGILRRPDLPDVELWRDATVTVPEDPEGVQVLIRTDVGDRRLLGQAAEPRRDKDGNLATHGQFEARGLRYAGSLKPGERSPALTWRTLEEELAATSPKPAAAAAPPPKPAVAVVPPPPAPELAPELENGPPMFHPDGSPRMVLDDAAAAADLAGEPRPEGSARPMEAPPAGPQ